MKEIRYKVSRNSGLRLQGMFRIRIHGEREQLWFLEAPGERGTGVTAHESEASLGPEEKNLESDSSDSFTALHIH